LASVSFRPCQRARRDLLTVIWQTTTASQGVLVVQAHLAQVTLQALATDFLHFHERTVAPPPQAIMNRTRGFTFRMPAVGEMRSVLLFT
jgi:methylphosphotriester-DNA--protein-cysteine methyltransferase